MEFPQLITDAYRAQNKATHELGNKWGMGSWKWSERVLQLRDDLKAETVLDYGCGKGLLKNSLGDPDWITEYDPGIPGKDVLPKTRFDIVVCTDVLEHVEPDLLENNLDTIRLLARKAAFLTIATRPAKQMLPDGRNAHLIIENADWWKARLEKHFNILSWHATGGEVVATVQALHLVKHITPKSAVSDDIRFEQAKVNMLKTPRRLHYRPVHEGTALIACYGPSLIETWQHLAWEKQKGGVVVSVSGAHDFLIERGVIPDIHIDVDPREHKGYFTRNPHPDVKYWMASCLHPSVIDRLVPYDLSLWHVYSGEIDKQLTGADKPDEPAHKGLDADPNAILLGGGGSVGCRAFNVMYTQGYRRFLTYGMDCSFSWDGMQHAADHSGKKQHQWTVKCGERWFRTSGTLIAIARGFVANLNSLERASSENNEPIIQGNRHIDLTLVGDGLLQEMMRLAMAGKLAAITAWGKDIKGDPDTEVVRDPAEETAA